MTDDDEHATPKPPPPRLPRTPARKPTPVAGVGVIPSVIKTEPGTPEQWESQRTAMPRVLAGRDETILAGIDRRTRESKNLAFRGLDRVDALRTETRADIHRVETKVENTGEKLDAVIEVVGDLRAEVGEQGGQNKVIIDLLTEARDSRTRTETVITTTQIANTEVDKVSKLTGLEIVKAAQLATIDAEAKAKADRREMIKAFFYKALAGAGILWAFVSVTYLANCGK